MANVSNLHLFTDYFCNPTAFCDSAPNPMTVIMQWNWCLLLILNHCHWLLLHTTSWQWHVSSMSSN